MLAPRNPRSIDARDPRSGAALMLSLLVLFVLVAIVFQLNIATGTDARIARNEVTLIQMDLAIASAQLQVFENLKSDAQSSEGGAAGGMGGGGGGMPGLPQGSGGSAEGLQGFGGAGGGGNPFGGGSPFGGGGAGDGAGAQQGPVDSRMDSWGRPERTSINEIDLRILIQDEDSKYNLLAILTKNEDEARKALDRLTRIIDMYREGTEADVDGARARRMAESIRDHLKLRLDSVLPRPALLTDTDKDGNTLEQGLPLSLREFAVLPGFDDSQFRDFRDSEGHVVHALSSFLTVWTSLSTRAELMQELGASSGEPGTPPGTAGAGNNNQGNSGDSKAPSGGSGGSGFNASFAGAQGSGTAGAGGGGTSDATGIAVNVNTAPAAVLKALFDDRDIPPQFWDGVIEYRNLEDEEATEEAEKDGEEAEPEYDEWGREVLPRKFFKSLGDLKEVDGWENIEPQQQAEIQQMLTVQSNVFSVYITARKRTAAEDGSESLDDPVEVRKREERGGYLTRTVRIVVWRRAGGSDGVQLVPLECWETIDYSPFEVLDYPDEER
ncbi:MAG: general secretion pathway protein GspK [Planctomycetes bacterium]|nr:general secretion pathway protein GspK [Planctomycetota bacterium]